MYCKNCGNEIKDNERFCSKCGTSTSVGNSNTEATVTKSYPIAIFNKKAIIIVGLIAVIAVFLIIIVSHNSNPEKQIQGTWQLNDISFYSDFDNYPECEYMTFLGDGTGYCDDNINETFVYKIDKNTLIMDSDDWLCSYTYNYEINGKELSISYMNDNPIFYNKIITSKIETSKKDSNSHTYAPMKTVEGEPRWSN